jgi:hypothetical protein
MKSSFKMIRTGVLAAFVFGSIASVSAAGLVGQRAVQVMYNYTNYKSSDYDSSGGYTFFANMPVKQDLLDVGFNYTQYDQDSAVFGQPDRSRSQALVMATLYGVEKGHKPYFRVGLGAAEWEYQPTDTRDGFAYFAEIGVEFVYSERLRATPYVSWVDTFETETRGDLHYGIITDITLSKNVSALIGISGDENKNFTGSIGVGFSF